MATSAPLPDLVKHGAVCSFVLNVRALAGFPVRVRRLFAKYVFGTSRYMRRSGPLMPRTLRAARATKGAGYGDRGCGWHPGLWSGREEC